ncbi:hypothetical protein POMI540_0934 [Schizosaccharomyces pombe]|uniref:Protein pet117, mitochondrial n=1 Tax=Schizosaccharomyces pombe (strain 972 / ATCC 24843) TaxID=284812 RepID=PT117_SCHPO|nr:putative Pet117 cytochrome c oxidase assemby protein [Schizosaccharomyces pombe]C6Y4C1.1 RecName: Full=Protein pet117, mitochondrial; Flags: Precursor [Schizosaccharomyces pombe 972h-]CBA11510.1 Pet117 cytochrome c oxidase assemby protein (predicted) [Schizosaccharomyces pombe]|eukprot:NP_001343085.1 putative Pet117 cytochrome c oxidase assemby protein [Schizosaccharomyces pombe]
MSTASKLCIVGAGVFSVYMVYFVHNNQIIEREKMSAGVQKDDERKRIKKERFEDLKRQQELRKFYESQLPVEEDEKGLRQTTQTTVND